MIPAPTSTARRSVARKGTGRPEHDESERHDTLVGGLISHGHRRALPLAGEEALADFVRTECRPGDMLVCLGAGSIGAWANALPERLAAGNHHREKVEA